jgi:hypothetical protein
MLLPCGDDLEIEHIQDNHKALLSVSLPIFRLFSPEGTDWNYCSRVCPRRTSPQNWGRLKRSFYQGMLPKRRRQTSTAIHWGFGVHIIAMRRERKETVNPFLEAQQHQILRRILARDRKQYERARHRFL